MQPPEIVIFCLLLFLFFCLIALGVVVCMESYLKHRSSLEVLAEANEQYVIHARIVYSNQTSSAQPVITINSPAIPLFDSVDNPIYWKRWVKDNFPYGPFPVIINRRIQ